MQLLFSYGHTKYKCLYGKGGKCEQCLTTSGNEDNIADQNEILQHTQVDIINSVKLGSMKRFNTASGFVNTELLMQLLH